MNNTLIQSQILSLWIKYSENDFLWNKNHLSLSAHVLSKIDVAWVCPPLACYDQWWCLMWGQATEARWAALGSGATSGSWDKYTGTDRPSIKTSSGLLWVTLPVTRVTCHKICEGKINRRGGNLTSNSILWLSLQFPVDLLLTRMAPGNKMIIKRVFISPHDRVYRIHEHLGKWGTHSHII